MYTVTDIPVINIIAYNNAIKCLSVNDSTTLNNVNLKSYILQWTIYKK